MAGAIRPPSPTENLQKTGSKRAKTSNEHVETLSKTGEQPAPVPFPGLIHASAEIETHPPKVKLMTLTSCTNNFFELLKVFNQDELDVDDRAASEIALKFYASPQVESMNTALQITPSLCPLYIKKYFALEKQGAAHVTALVAKIARPLLRFLPLCTHLQEFEIEIENLGNGQKSDEIKTLMNMISRCATLEKFKLRFSPSDSPLTPKQMDALDINLEDLLKILFNLPNLKTIELVTPLSGYVILAYFYDFLAEEFNRKLRTEASHPQVKLVDKTQKYLCILLSRVEFNINKINQLTKLNLSQKELLDLLVQLIPELGHPSNENIEVKSLEVRYVEEDEIVEGFLSIEENSLNKLPSLSPNTPGIVLGVWYQNKLS